MIAMTIGLICDIYMGFVNIYNVPLKMEELLRSGLQFLTSLLQFFIHRITFPKSLTMP